MAPTTNGVGDSSTKNVDLVFEGGGVRGIALVGALAVLEERGYQPRSVAGTSAGAIVATLVGAGLKAAQIQEIIADLDFSKMKDEGWEDRIPAIGVPLSIVTQLGIYEGGFFLGLMRRHLELAGIRTFRDLIDQADSADPRYRYKVRVIASDVTGRCLLALPQDAEDKLGTPADDLDVALAVRMSMSIPIFFEPVRFKNPLTQQEHLIVDGGLLSNFPVWLFDSDGVPEWPTFGLRLVESDLKSSLALGMSPPERSSSGLGGLIDFLKSLVETATQAHDRMYIEQDNFVRTIAIPTLGISSTNFELTADQAESLYQSGRAAAERFLETWDFEAYKAEFRSGKEHSRSQDLAAKLGTDSSAAPA